MTVFIGFLDKKIQFTSGSGYRSKQAENIHKEQQLLIDSLIKHGCTYFHDGYDIYIMITEIASIGTLDQIIFDAGLKSQRTLDDSFFSETIL